MDAKKTAIYPLLILKEAWGVWQKNLLTLSTIYLIFYLPFLLLSIIVALCPGDQSRILFLANAIISLLSSVALLTAASAAANGEPVEIVKNTINAIKKHFLDYLGVNLIFLLCVFAAAPLTTAILMVPAAVFQFNPLLLFVAQIIIVGAMFAVLLFFTIRWSLGGVVSVLENIHPFAALKRSRILVQDHINPILGEYGLFLLTIILFNLPFIILFSIFTDARINSGAGISQETTILAGALNNLIVHSAFVPLVALVVVVLYKKLTEAKDIHVCA